MSGGSTSSAHWAGPYGPVGTVLAEGSTGLRMSRTERQLAEFIATGQSYKVIAHRMGMPLGTLGTYVAKLAARIPGQGNPRQKVSAWMWVYGSESHPD